MTSSVYLDFYKIVSANGPEEGDSWISQRLSEEDSTVFSETLDSRFTNPPTRVNDWLKRMAGLLSKQASLAMIYVEMNGFDINTDRWFCDAFGFSRQIDLERLDELALWDSELPHSEALTLEGMEAMQRAFERWRQDLSTAPGQTSKMAVALVQARFLTLIKEAVAVGGLATPVAAATHDSDLVLRFDPPPA